MSQRVLDRPIRAMLAAAAGSALAAGVGGIGSRRAPVVYARLTKPRWAPPPSAFGPVWTVLYALMAIAAYRAWKADPARWRGLLVLHGGQLALNAAWPVDVLLGPVSARRRRRDHGFGLPGDGRDDRRAPS